MPDSLDIAIVGLAARFPGAPTVDDFWRNLADGVESISRFTDDEVRGAGVTAETLADPHYVKAGGILDGIEWFDARFFGCTPREADVMDPQQRVFLECAWEALEDAGYDSERYRRPVGVYAGMSMNTYVLSNLIFNPAAVDAIGASQAAISNLHDHLATRVSYALDLRGPSFTVQTACSTSLVAVHLACQGLLAGECDMALAGGVSISIPAKAGYLYQEGGVHSPDGHCRAFDASANGMVGGSGVGVVVLKRLEEAEADRDRIVAIIKGTAINNDGAAKVGYAAPSVEGQARVIRAAMQAAAVAPETIAYVEAHGTGTAIGDPIEVEALARAFRSAGTRTERCGLGSVKTNVGHLDAAAGVAGLIKTALALEHRYLPPTLHFQCPNPRIDFAATPFSVVAQGREWLAGPVPRRAGVSAFGIGGTNAHAILEEAPLRRTPATLVRPELLVVSARTEAALYAARQRLAAHLEQHPEAALADVAWTLQAGRRGFPVRAAAVVSSHGDAVARLRAARPPAPSGSIDEAKVRTTALLFPGQGAQYPGMGRALYERYVPFQAAIDEVAGHMAPHLAIDLRTLLGYQGHVGAAELQRTEHAQPALFAVEYATARLLAAAGITVSAAIGHSVGEYVAACLAGVFTVADASALIAIRGRLMSQAPSGSMLAVGLSEREAVAQLRDGLALAAVNGPRACVVSGDSAKVATLESDLQGQGIATARLHTSHAFHSPLMDGVVEMFEAELAGRPRSAPRVPFVSNLTGRWIEASEATDPHYWARHLREPVRFADSVVEAASTVSRFVEAGPGMALTTLGRTSLAGRDVSWLTTLPRAESAETAGATMLAALGRLWSERVAIDWAGLGDLRPGRRVALPTYPFERTRHWIDPVDQAPGGLGAHVQPSDTALRFYAPEWRRGTARPLQKPQARRRWLVICDGFGLGEAVARGLEALGDDVTALADAGRVPAAADIASALAPGRTGAPDTIVYCASAAPWTDSAPDAARPRAFDGLVDVVRALEARSVFSPIRLEIVSSNLWDVIGDEPIDPWQSLLVGPLRVLPQEHPNLATRNIDVTWTAVSVVESLASRIVAELTGAIDDQVVALRSDHRWLPRYADVEETREPASVGTCAIVIGGTGQIGQVAARALAANGVGQIVLAARRVDRDSPVIGELRAQGIEVLTESVDVEDAQALRDLFARVAKHSGGVSVVVHAAGPSGESALSPLADPSRAHPDRQFGAKVRGLAALASAVNEFAPRLVVLTSSLSTVLGGLGFGAYASANAVMDAMATLRNRTGEARWVSVGWDGWRFDADQVAGSIDRSAGEAAISRILRHTTGARVVVTVGDLEPRLLRWINPGTKTSAAASRAHQVARPAGQAATPPVNDLERLVLQAWVELLGVEGAGVDDNFFELGGHSLLATQLVNRLRRSLLLDVPLRAVFEAPTVRGMAEAIIAREPAPGQAVATARLRLQLGRMTPEQRRAMADARLPAGGVR